MFTKDKFKRMWTLAVLLHEDKCCREHYTGTSVLPFIPFYSIWKNGTALGNCVWYNTNA